MGTSTQTSKQSGTSTQAQQLDPQQQKLTNLLFQQIKNALKLGPTVSQSDLDTDRARINQEYAGASSNLESNLTARGFGSSGLQGSGLEKLAIGKVGEEESSVAQRRREAQTNFQQMIQNAFGFNIPRSSTSTSTGTSKSQSDPSIFSDILGGLGALGGLGL